MQRFTAFRCNVVFAALALTGWLAAQAMASGLTFDIAAGSATMTLKEFASQAHVQLLFDYKAVQNLKTPAVKGQLTPIEALKEMLEGSGFTFREINDHTIAVMAPGASPTSMATQEPASPGTDAQKEGKNSSQQFLLAQATPGQASGDVSVEQQEEEKAKKKALLQEVVVTGSRIPHTGMQTSQPVQTYTREQIDASGQPSLTDFLNTLPQVSTQVFQAQYGTIGGATTVQLHGLPVGTTLVLLDGQRTATGRVGFFDLGAIPYAAIERVEVIPVGSSAIYGSDAIGGAVNIVLRKGYNGVEADARYGWSNGTDTTNVNLALGKDWGRGAVSLVATFQDQGSLLGSQRSVTSIPDLSAVGGLNWSGDDCKPGTVYSLTGQNLPGLNSPNAAVPPNIHGTATISDFQSTAGLVNLCSGYLLTSLIPPQQQEGALMTSHYQVTDHVDLFADVLYSRKTGHFYFGSKLDLSMATMSANNPYNPFGQDVAVSYADPDFLRDYASTQSSVRPTLGARGTFAGEWYWEASGVYSYDRLRVSQTTINNAAINAALTSSDPATALNVFTSDAPGSNQLLNSFFSVDTTKLDNRVTSAEVFVRGPLVHLIPGTVDSVFGVEYDRFQEDDHLSAAVADSHSRRDAYGLFTEQRIPLMASPRADAEKILVISLAARYDHSNDFGGKGTGQGGIEWRPADSLLVRGAYSTAYRAPELTEISGLTTTARAIITDPARGNQRYAIPFVTGPNPDLEPETGVSRSLGLVYSSKAFEGLDASATYWTIYYKNHIATPGVQTVISFPSAYPADFLTRAAPTPQDIQNGYAGVITSAKNEFVNFGNIHVTGLDLDVSYRVPTKVGEFTPRLAVTDTDTFKYALTPRLPQQNGLNQANNPGQFGLRWKGTATLSWNYGPAFAVLDGRYVGHYNDYANLGGALPHDIGGFWLYDMSLGYDLGKVARPGNSWLEGARLAVGGVNIFNKSSPISYYPTGYDPNEYDILGRILYARIQARF